MKDKKIIIAAVALVLVFAVALFAYLKQDKDSPIGTIGVQTTDLTGNEVDDSIFADYDLTMINIWAHQRCRLSC